MRGTTQQLKIRVMRDFASSLDWEHWTNAVGLRADEARRVARIKDQRERWDTIAPLREAGVTQPDIAAFWGGQPFDLGQECIDGKPLAFRVAYLPHDDGSRLLYRDVDSFLQALIEALNGDEPACLSLHDTQGDYPPDAPRNQADQQAARALMATDGPRNEWNYAAQLLDASNLAEWATLLETDHFVRRDVVARMEKMTDPEIRELLRRDRVAFDEFATRAAEAAREAGLEVGRRNQDALQVGGKWMNLEVFFHRRRIPDAVPRMLAWFEDLIAGRNPHDRPGHFMCD
jgi:hypothetical protein